MKVFTLNYLFYFCTYINIIDMPLFFSFFWNVSIFIESCLLIEKLLMYLKNVTNEVR